MGRIVLSRIAGPHVSILCLTFFPVFKCGKKLLLNLKTAIWKMEYQQLNVHLTPFKHTHLHTHTHKLTHTHTQTYTHTQTHKLTHTHT